jgi:hypothetical protein
MRNLQNYYEIIGNVNGSYWAISEVKFHSFDDVEGMKYITKILTL